jgi:hypothetical protein
MAYSIRNAYYLKSLNSENDTEYIKQICVKNKNWSPTPAPVAVEESMTEFEKALKTAQNQLIRKTKKTIYAI